MKNTNNLQKAIEILQTVGSLDMTIVPIEPTVSMICAAKKIVPDIGDAIIKEIYAAMLLASDESMLL